MLYTAAIMVCLIDKPRTYDTCQIINAHFKYTTEEQCWSAINGQVQYQGKNMLKVGYELADAKCISWLESENLKKINS